MKGCNAIKCLTLFMILLFIFSTPIISADTLQYRMVEVYTPENVFIYNETAMTIVVIDPATGEPLLGMANNITCYVRRPTGWIFVNGQNPEEIHNGVYRLKFTLLGHIGTYTYWAVFDYNGIQYYGSGIFEGRWDPYTNLTEATYRIGDAVRLINIEDRNQTYQMATHLRETTLGLDQLGVKSEGLGILLFIQDILIGELFQIIIMVVLLLIAIYVMNWLYSRKKAQNLAKDVSKLPGMLVGLLKRED